jgi:ribosomal-protein-alanine N-acetyltransferase
VAVDPTRRRQGIARALLGGLLAEAQARDLRLVVLEVRPSNREAIALYESFGFRVTGRRRGYYYDTGEDALIMETRLPVNPSMTGNRRAV